MRGGGVEADDHVEIVEQGGQVGKIVDVGGEVDQIEAGGWGDDAAGVTALEGEKAGVGGLKQAGEDFAGEGLEGAGRGVGAPDDADVERGRGVGSVGLRCGRGEAGSPGGGERGIGVEVAGGGGKVVEGGAEEAREEGEGAVVVDLRGAVAGVDAFVDSSEVNQEAVEGAGAFEDDVAAEFFDEGGVAEEEDEVGRGGGGVEEDLFGEEHFAIPEGGFGGGRGEGGLAVQIGPGEFFPAAGEFAGAEEEVGEALVGGGVVGVGLEGQRVGGHGFAVVAAAFEEAAEGFEGGDIVGGTDDELLEGLLGGGEVGLAELEGGEGAEVVGIAGGDVEGALVRGGGEIELVGGGVKGGDGGGPLGVGGLEAGEVAQMSEGGLGVVLALEDIGEALVEEHGVGMFDQERAVGIEGVVEAAQVGEDFSAGDGGFEKLRGDLEGFFGGGEGVGQAGVGLVDGGQVPPGEGFGGTGGDGLLDEFGGDLDAAALKGDEAEKVEGRGLLAILGQDLAIDGFGIVEATRLMERNGVGECLLDGHIRA